MMALQRVSTQNNKASEYINANIDILDRNQELGAIYTRPEVVDFILDLVGYTTDKPLYTMRILEPSFGAGDFLISIIKRLFESWKKEHAVVTFQEELKKAIFAVELDLGTYRLTYNRVVNMLQKEGLAEKDASILANSWLKHGDFLTCEIEWDFDFVVGNPPYIRQELIPPQLMEKYRTRYKTISDRADIYIPFIERSLSILRHGGELSFICADRWMKNQYGRALRQMIASRYHLKIYVDMVGTLAFKTDVTAYPAIIVINHETSDTTRIAHRPNVNSKSLSALARKLTMSTLTDKNDDDNNVYEIESVTNGHEPWLLGLPNQMELVRNIERKFPRLEDVGCKIGIGVATGADKVFISNYDTLDVEPTRKLPLVTTKDILKGEIDWQGNGVINPFEEDGHLVNLHDYPKLRSYLESRRNLISNRHCAKKSPSSWYRTIDRINPALISIPKLLIPDIKGEPHIVFEEGRLYPHHNLYYITSNVWDLRALQAVLLSAIAKLFIANYSTKMRGDYLRFQAQYLRRICIPDWNNVSETLRNKLVDAATKRDIAACNQAVFELYALNGSEQAIVEGGIF